MPIALGVEAYTADTTPIVARGYLMTRGDLEKARAMHIPSVLRDEPGHAGLTEFCDSLALTGFGDAVLKETLEPISEESHSKGWREGEALAEAWLTEHRACEFPWPFKRDLRHHKASLPGAELVGVCGATPSDCLLAVGQVKTSKENRQPPQVVSKKSDGLIRQMADLRENDDLKKAIIQYLAHRAAPHPTASWVGKFRTALSKYCNSGRLAIAIFGVLVRDVAANALDLSGAARTLSTGCSAPTRMELVALYLPEGSIPSGPQHGPRKMKEDTP